MVTKILKKYKSKEGIEVFKNRLINKKVYFGNKISIARRNIVMGINDILNNEDKFVECNICQKLYSQCEVIENFDNDLTVCNKCQNEYYLSCESCYKPLYCESEANKYHNDSLYCEDCYFEIKDNEIQERIIQDKKLKVLDRLLRFNKKLASNYEYKIKGYWFNIENFGYNRLGSWSANFWIDLTSNKDYLLQAIDWGLDYIIQASIEDIREV